MSSGSASEARVQCLFLECVPECCEQLRARSRTVACGHTSEHALLQARVPQVCSKAACLGLLTQRTHQWLNRLRIPRCCSCWWTAWATCRCRRSATARRSRWRTRPCWTQWQVRRSSSLLLSRIQRSVGGHVHAHAWRRRPILGIADRALPSLRSGGAQRSSRLCGARAGVRLRHSAHVPVRLRPAPVSYVQRARSAGSNAPHRQHQWARAAAGRWRRGWQTRDLAAFPGSAALVHHTPAPLRHQGSRRRCWAASVVLTDAPPAHACHPTRRHYRGRGAFESMGAGIPMAPGDIAFKCNFATLDPATGVVLRRRADRNFEHLGPTLCAALDGAWGGRGSEGGRLRWEDREGGQGPGARRNARRANGEAARRVACCRAPRRTVRRWARSVRKSSRGDSALACGLRLRAKGAIGAMQGQVAARHVPVVCASSSAGLPLPSFPEHVVRVKYATEHR